jgi:membrane associated rhomboid family serine protease
MLIPYAVDVPMDRRPVVNILLIAATVAAFGLQITAPDEETVLPYVLDGWKLQGVFGHMFLHGGIPHLAGNMLFLWVFGNAVCAKIGNLAYIPVYLFLGISAAAAHLILDGDPAVGASGAIYGIIGIYLVLYSFNEIDCLFFIWIMYRPIIKTFSVSSFWIILYWIAFDVVGTMIGGGHVAHFAHLGGFAAGVGLAVLLCGLNFIKMSDDESSLVQLWRRRQQDRLDDRLQREALKAIQERKDVKPVNPPAPQSEMIRFICPCGQRIKVPAGMAGRQGKCPGCRSSIMIPHL